MPFIEITEGVIPPVSGFTNYQVYNCLDSAITAQLVPAMSAVLNENTLSTYRREMELQSLCLEMSAGGFTINQWALIELIHSLRKDADRALSILHRFCEAVGARPINPRSSVDVPWFFYEHLNLPPIYEFDRKTKQKKVSADAKALEKLRTNYPSAMPFVNAILWFREASKMASVFARGLEPGTSNLRCNFSPSGTETGRLSSQQNPYGRGTNAQNLTDRVRQVISAPEGWAIVNFDLKTAESLAVGFIAGATSYIEGCLAGDVHTVVCRLVWPELPWTGNLKKDKDIAEQPFYRHFSYRDMGKRGGHGTNYFGTARTMAMHLKVETKLIEHFQNQYLGNPDLGIAGAFPEIRAWHYDVIARIQRDGRITNQLGRERRFWGRPDDAATWREAIAYDPQSLVADVMNEGLKQAQRWLLRNAPHVAKQTWQQFGTSPIMAQVHDAGVFLLPIDEVHQLVPLLEQQLLYPVDFGTRGVMTIPFDASIGKSWNKLKLDKTGAPKGSKYERGGQRGYKLNMDLGFLK